MADKITKETNIGEVVTKFPSAAPILAKNGFHCIGCHVAMFETLEQGAFAHGMNEDKLKNMIKEMNEVIKGV